MGRDWIIDVLADLRRFACENELPLLGAQLQEAELIAELELAAGASGPALSGDTAPAAKERMRNS